MREGVNGHLLHVLLPHLGLGISSPRLLLQGAVRGPFSSNTVTGGSVYGAYGMYYRKRLMIETRAVDICVYAYV